jgi:hypothetical protein
VLRERAAYTSFGADACPAQHDTLLRRGRMAFVGASAQCLPRGSGATTPAVAGPAGAAPLLRALASTVARDGRVPCPPYEASARRQLGCSVCAPRALGTGSGAVPGLFAGGSEPSRVAGEGAGQGDMAAAAAAEHGEGKGFVGAHVTATYVRWGHRDCPHGEWGMWTGFVAAAGGAAQDSSSSSSSSSEGGGGVSSGGSERLCVATAPDGQRPVAKVEQASSKRQAPAVPSAPPQQRLLSATTFTAPAAAEAAAAAAAAAHGSSGAPTAPRLARAAACAVCAVRGTPFVTSGSDVCPFGTRREYAGWLMATPPPPSEADAPAGNAEADGATYCVDGAMQQLRRSELLRAGERSGAGPPQRGASWHAVGVHAHDTGVGAARCAPPLCPPYAPGQRVPCAVCVAPGAGAVFTHWGGRMPAAATRSDDVSDDEARRRAGRRSAPCPDGATALRQGFAARLRHADGAGSICMHTRPHWREWWRARMPWPAQRAAASVVAAHATAPSNSDPATAATTVSGAASAEWARASSGEPVGCAVCFWRDHAVFTVEGADSCPASGGGAATEKKEQQEGGGGGGGPAVWRILRGTAPPGDGSGAAGDDRCLDATATTARELSRDAALAAAEEEEHASDDEAGFGGGRRRLLRARGSRAAAAPPAVPCASCAVGGRLALHTQWGRRTCAGVGVRTLASGVTARGGNKGGRAMCLAGDSLNGDGLSGGDEPCARCGVPGSTFMLPGRANCPAGEGQTIFSGVLRARGSRLVCFPTAARGGGGATDGGAEAWRPATPDCGGDDSARKGGSFPCAARGSARGYAPRQTLPCCMCRLE